ILDLAFHNLIFSYSGDERGTALQQVSFTAKPGETVALVGCSGAGKSTIAALIPRFYDVSEGVITLDGHPIQNYRLHDFRSNIAMVTQNVVLLMTACATTLPTVSCAMYPMKQLSRPQKLHMHG